MPFKLTSAIAWKDFAAVGLHSNPATSTQQSSKVLSVPPDSSRWALEGEARVAEHLGRKSLWLDGGTATLKDFVLRDGTIDVDVATPAARGFFGIQFRISEDEKRRNRRW